MPQLPVMLIFALLSGGAPFAGTSFQTSSRLTTLPDNPCELFTQAQMAAITDLDVTAVRREPSISKIVEAQRKNHAPGPGTICSYETHSPFGAISIFVPPRTARTTAVYWAARSKYFETYPRSARPIPDVAMDAWLAGGAALHVLVRDHEYFSLSAQMYPAPPEGQAHELFVQCGQLLVKIATAITARF